MPSLYNLACSGLLPEHFGVVGLGRSSWTTESFRERMTQDIHTFSTRSEFNEDIWAELRSKLYYVSLPFQDPDSYHILNTFLTRLASELHTSGNILFYLATPPSIFGEICENMHQAQLHLSDDGWRRVIVEKPFGHDLPSAIELNRLILRYWTEDQIYRIDHYLGKETVQNILAFRFANGLFESVWNRQCIDHIQITVSESVGVEGRGEYYETSGVLRDMIQNHMLQILSYLCMEPPSSFRADSIRNEKVKVLDSVRILNPADVPAFAVRGQYGEGIKQDGTKLPAYRQEEKVNPESKTETFAALKLLIDNWRWEGVPVYLRSGKRLWKKGTEVVIEFKKTPHGSFRGTGISTIEPNRLIFHIQPDQGIELRFQTKVPGPKLDLQNVNMRFGYGEVFRAERGTGYEHLLYSAMSGDATLFSRTDFVEACWSIAQPVLDYWSSEPAPEFPNYPAVSWGPRSASDLIERDGRRWIEIINRSALQQIPLFHSADAQLLNALVVLLQSRIFSPGQEIVRRGEPGNEMYIISRGQVEILDEQGEPVATLQEGNFFGEISLLFSAPRTATVRAKTQCDMFTLSKDDFLDALRDHPEVANIIMEAARTRYPVSHDSPDPD
jgi:glucose-6-phosphate 1-dehydrogenase